MMSNTPDTARATVNVGGVVVGVILAGGRGRRMAGVDKLSSVLAGRSLLARVIERAQPQVARLAINANGDAGRLVDYSLPVLADSIADFAGPLAGVLAGMEWAASQPDCRWLVTFPADAPFLPYDLVGRLLNAAMAASASMALATSGGRLHPVFGLWSPQLRGDLRRALVEEGLRKVDLWTARHHPACVNYPVDPVDPFFNVNRPADLTEAERLLPVVEALGR